MTESSGNPFKFRATGPHQSRQQTERKSQLNSVNEIKGNSESVKAPKTSKIPKMSYKTHQ